MLRDTERAEMVEHQRTEHLAGDNQSEHCRGAGTIRATVPMKIELKIPPVHVNQDVRAAMASDSHGSSDVMATASVANVAAR